MASLGLLLATLASFASVVFTCVAIGVPSWAAYGADGSLGLWAVSTSTGYFTWPQLALRCAPNCPSYIATWQTAGAVGGTFLILALLCQVGALVLCVMRVVAPGLPHARAKLVATLSLVLAALALGLGWFAWALWSSLRVFPAAFGFGYFAVVFAYCLSLVALVFLLLDRSGNDYERVPEHGEHELHRDFHLPPYRFSLGDMAVYSRWNAPGASRLLFFALSLYAAVQYIFATTDQGISSAQQQWSTIILGGLYLVCFVLASRIVCELVLVAFVAKDRYVNKDVDALKASAPRPEHRPVVEVLRAEPVTASPAPEGGGYQKI